MPDRCFIAVDLEDARTRSRLMHAQRIIEETGADVKSVEEENLHVTVRFLGEIPEAQTARVADLVRGISFKPFKLGFRGVGVFPGLNRPSVVWAGIVGDLPEMLAAYGEVSRGLGKLGFERDRRGFQPHLTICRVRSGRSLGGLGEAIRGMEHDEFGEQLVSCLRLKKSVLTARGPVYSTVAESRSA